MWLTWHVVYYEPEKDGLLVEGIYRPLQELAEAGLVERYFCLRHWRQGPHVRVNVVPRAGHESEVTARFERAVTDYLGQNPSRVVVNAEALLATHRRLAEIELDAGQLEPLRPDNSIHVAPYQPPFVMAGPAAIRAAESFYSEATPVLFDAIAATRNDRSARLAAMLRYMLALAGVAGDPRYYSLSYRSHAEGYLKQYDRNGALRTQYELELDQNRDGHVAMFNDVMGHVRGGEAGPDLAAWVRVTGRHFAAVKDLLEQGAIELPGEEYFRDRASSLGFPGHQGEQSQFHQQFRQSTFYVQNQHFVKIKVVRCFVNWYYTLFTLTGMTPKDRVRLCYLAARIVEIASGKTWQELIQSADPVKP